MGQVDLRAFNEIFFEVLTNYKYWSIAFHIHNSTLIIVCDNLQTTKSYEIVLEIFDFEFITLHFPDSEIEFQPSDFIINTPEHFHMIGNAFRHFILTNDYSRFELRK